MKIPTMVIGFATGHKLLFSSVVFPVCHCCFINGNASRQYTSSAVLVQKGFSLFLGSRLKVPYCGDVSN